MLFAGISLRVKARLRPRARVRRGAEQQHDYAKLLGKHRNVGIRTDWTWGLFSNSSVAENRTILAISPAQMPGLFAIIISGAQLEGTMKPSLETSHLRGR